MGLPNGLPFLRVLRRPFRARRSRGRAPSPRSRCARGRGFASCRRSRDRPRPRAARRGTRTFSNVSSAVSLERQPSFRGAWTRVNPGVPCSTTNAVMPSLLRRRPGWCGRGPRRSRRRVPWVMNIFVPLRTHVVAVAPRRRREGRRVAAAARLGERPRREPLARCAAFGRYLRFCASVPNARTWPVPRPLCDATVSASRAVDARDLFDARSRSSRVHPGAAVLLGDADAEEAHARRASGRSPSGSAPRGPSAARWDAISARAKSRTLCAGACGARRSRSPWGA